MNWMFKREVVVVLWILVTLFEAGMATWALVSGNVVWAWVLYSIVVFLLVMGPGRWVTMFADKEDRKGWWLYEDL